MTKKFFVKRPFWLVIEQINNKLVKIWNRPWENMIGGSLKAISDNILVSMRKTAYIKRCFRIRGVCVCTFEHVHCFNTSISWLHLQWKSRFIDPKRLYFLQVSKLIKTSSSHRCHILFCSCNLLCLSMHPSLSLFFISSSLSLCRHCIRAQRRAGRSTARHKTQMGNVSAPLWLQHRTCVIETHVADSSVN